MSLRIFWWRAQVMGCWCCFLWRMPFTFVQRGCPRHGPPTSPSSPMGPYSLPPVGSDRVTSPFTRRTSQRCALWSCIHPLSAWKHSLTTTTTSLSLLPLRTKPWVSYTYPTWPLSGPSPIRNSWQQLWITIGHLLASSSDVQMDGYWSPSGIECFCACAPYKTDKLF